MRILNQKRKYFNPKVSGPGRFEYVMKKLEVENLVDEIFGLRFFKDSVESIKITVVLRRVGGAEIVLINGNISLLDGNIFM